MKVLVTGGGGFLGTHICQNLKEKGYEVCSLTRGKYPHLDQIGVEQFQIDLSNFNSVEEFFLQEGENITAVIHTAAKAGIWGRYESFYQANVVGTENLVACMKRFGIKFLVYTSTPSVVFGKEAILGGNERMDYPSKYLSDYAQTKMIAEKLVRRSDKDGLYNISFRPHLIFGKGDPHLVPKILELCQKGRLPIIGKGINEVDVTYVENAAEAHVLGLEKLMEDPKRYSSEVYFVGQEKPVKLWSFIEEICLRHNVKPPQKKMNLRKAFLLGSVIEKVWSVLKIKKDPPMTRFVALQLGKDHYFSHQKLTEELGFEYKYNLKDSIDKTFKSS